LLVADGPMLVQSLCSIIAMNGFEVTTATNVTEALRHISSQPLNSLVSETSTPTSEQPKAFDDRCLMATFGVEHMFPIEQNASQRPLRSLIWNS
jgi:hypothetical protein